MYTNATKVAKQSRFFVLFEKCARKLVKNPKINFFPNKPKEKYRFLSYMFVMWHFMNGV